MLLLFTSAPPVLRRRSGGLNDWGGAAPLPPPPPPRPGRSDCRAASTTRDLGAGVDLQETSQSRMANGGAATLKLATEARDQGCWVDALSRCRAARFGADICQNVPACPAQIFNSWLRISLAGFILLAATLAVPLRFDIPHHPVCFSAVCVHSSCRTARARIAAGARYLTTSGPRPWQLQQETCGRRQRHPLPTPASKPSTQ
jgi:hypothetical protein